MKLLAVFFLVGLALASAVPVPSYQEISLDDVEELDYLLSTLPLEAEKRSIKDDIKQKLRDAYDRIMEKMKDAIDKGGTVGDRTLEKLKEIRGRFKDTSELDGKAKSLLEKFTGKPREVFEKILEKLGIRKRSTDFEFADERDNSELARQLKEKFEEVAQKIKDALENGKYFKEGLEKLREITQKLRDLRVTLGEKGKELVKNLKEKLREYFDKLLEKFTDKRDVDFKELLRKLREKVENTLDPEKIKNIIEKVFGKGSDITEHLIQKLKEKGGLWKEKILTFLDRLIGDKGEKRSVKEVYEKIKNYFKELQIELKEKFTKFGEWAKEKFEEGLENGRDKVENLKKLAREFINDAKIMRKDVAEQAKEFFREYKEDLGSIYDELKEKIREIGNRKD